MKIDHPYLRTQMSSGVGKVREKVDGKAFEGGSFDPSSVSVSDSASFMSALKDAAQQIPDIRPEVVAEAKDDVATGSVGTPEDYDRAISALLQEL